MYVSWISTQIFKTAKNFKIINIFKNKKITPKLSRFQNKPNIS